MKSGSLFTGIGGFDLGLLQAGIKPLWMAEKDRTCREVLSARFGDLPIYDDVDTMPLTGLPQVDIITGGDPCQENSAARQHGACRYPAKAESFIRIIQAMRPRWVIRENPATTRKDARWTGPAFAHALMEMNYDAIVVELSSACFTAQSRKRAFVIGSTGRKPFRRLVSILEGYCGDYPPHNGPKPLLACLTTHPRRMESRDNYILESDGRIRIPGIRERLRIQGFPDDWFAGFDFSLSRAARMTGNAVTVPVARWLAEAILQAETMSDQQPNNPEG